MISGYVFLAGDGSVVLSSSRPTITALPAILSAGPGTTLDTSNDITGIGLIGDGDTTLTLINEQGGIIDGTGSTPLVINTGTNVITNEGTLEATDGGTLDIASALAGTGSAVIQTGRLVLGNAFSQAVSFTPTDAGTLEIDQTSLFGGTIYDFGVGDTINLKNVAYDPAGTVSVEADANGVEDILTVVENGATYQFNLNPNQDYSGYDFELSPDSVYGGTDITVGGEYWINIAGGNWNTGADWSSGAVPGATDTAYIGLTGASPYTVSVTAPEAVGALVMNAANATLQVGGGGSLNVAGALTIDDETAGVAGLSISGGGVVSSASGDIDNGSGSAAVSISGTGSQWTMTGQLIVGVINAATGPTITVSNGANLTTSSAAATDYETYYDRLRSGSSLMLTTGGTFEDVYLYCEYGATVSLSSGAVMTLRGVTTTDDEWNLTVNGTMTLNDATLNSAPGAISIGYDFSGGETLSLGSVTASAGSQITSLITRLAWTSDATGSLTLSGAGTTWSDVATAGGPANSGTSYIGASRPGDIAD